MVAACVCGSPPAALPHRQELARLTAHLQPPSVFTCGAPHWQPPSVPAQFLLAHQGSRALMSEANATNARRESPWRLPIVTDTIPPDIRPGKLCGLSWHSDGHLPYIALQPPTAASLISEVTCLYFFGRTNHPTDCDPRSNPNGCSMLSARAEEDRRRIDG